MAIGHVSLPVSNITASTTFYLAALSPLTYNIYMKNDNFVGLAPKYGGPDFWLHSCSSKVISEGQNGKGAVHVAFAGSSKKVVHQFYEAALKAGAKDNGPPGERSYTKGYYAAYVLDLDGNNIECVYYQPWWLTALQTGPMVLGALAVAGVAWYGGQAGWGL